MSSIIQSSAAHSVLESAFFMKLKFMTLSRWSLVVAGVVFLSACAVSKYSYEKEDAGTVFLSLTSNDAMSPHGVAWTITFTPIDEKTKKEIPIFEVQTSTRIYEWAGKPEQQFQILSFDMFGNVKQTTKLPPGRYKVDAINRQEKLFVNNAPAGHKQIFFNETNPQPPAILRNMIRFPDAKAFPSIEFEVVAGKAVYLGSFNAGLFECTKVVIFESCAKFQVEVRDEFKRDSELLKQYQAKRPKEPNFEFMNQTVQIDAARSPHFFTKR